MSSRSQVFVVGTRPPPVSGASSVTDAIAVELLRSGRLGGYVDLGPGSRGPLRRATAAAACIVGLVRARPDFVYVQCYSGAGLLLLLGPLLLSRLLPAQTLIHHHSAELAKHGRRRLRILALAAGGDAVHIVLDPEMAADLRLSLKGVHTTVVKNLPFVSTAKAGGRPRSDVFRLGFLGNAIPSKGFATAANFAAELSRETPTEFHFAGGGLAEYLPPSSAILDDLVLVEYGQVDDVGRAAFFTNIDLLLFPSTYPTEAQPLVIYEALLAGVRVSAIDTGYIAGQAKEAEGLHVFSSESWGASTAALCRALGSLDAQVPLRVEPVRAITDRLFPQSRL